MAYVQLTSAQVAALNKALAPVFLAKEQETITNVLDQLLEMVSVRIGALDPTLVGLASVSTAANTLPYATGTDTFASTPLTAYARTLLAAIDAPAARIALGLGPVLSTTDQLPEGSNNLYFTNSRVDARGATNGWFANPMNQVGDIIIGSTGGLAIRLPRGTNGQILKLVAGAPQWQNEAAGGSSVWGGISGTLSNQTDLQSALDAKMASSNQAFLLARANHTGSQAASTISDFSEAVDDRVAGLLVPGSNVSLTYDDVANTLTVSASSSAPADNSITNAKLADVNTATFKGRATVGTGDPEDLTAAQAKTLLSLVKADVGLANVDNTADASKNVSSAATLTTGRTIALTGVVTAPGVAFNGSANISLSTSVADAALTVAKTAGLQAQLDGKLATSAGAVGTANLAEDSVTNAKLANVAASTLKGRITAGTGDPEDLTGTQATTLLNTFTSVAKGLVPASGGGTTTFLRADGAFATPAGGGGGSPGGSTNQIQYNNLGAFAGAAFTEIDATGHLVQTEYQEMVSTGTVPSTPAAGRLRMFARSRAGRVLPAVVGPAGIDVNLQPGLFANSQFIWFPGTGTTLAVSIGTAWSARNTGTGAAQSHPTRTSASAVDSLNRALFSTGTAISNASGVCSTTPIAWRGNAAGLGGFFFFARFAGAVSVASARFFVGLTSSAVSLSVEPSTLVNSVGLVKDSTDNNWFISTRDGTNGSKTDTAIVANTTDILDLYIFAAPNSSTVTVQVRNAVTNALLVNDVVLNTNLPTNTVYMNAAALVQTTVAATRALALNKIYVESDL